MRVPSSSAINIPFLLGWNGNSEDDIEGYYIYIRDSDTHDLSQITVRHTDRSEIITYEINEYVPLTDRTKYQLSSGRTYCISVSAHDINNNESEKTAEMCVYIDEVQTTTSTTSSIAPSRPPCTTTSIKPDETPPTGTVTINQGNETTGSHHVILSVSAEDAESGMDGGAQMSFSNDNSQWSIPEPFVSAKVWKLPLGGGQKKVYAKFSDQAGNWMDKPVSDSIELKLTCTETIQLETTAADCSGSYLPLWSEARAVDGKIATGWLSPLRRIMQDEYIMLDLGEMKVINRIDISSNFFMAFNLFPRDFKVQVSTDNQNWKDVITEQDYKPPVSRSGSWSFDGTEARYLKMIASKTQKFMLFFYVTYVAELKIFGCAAPETPGVELPSTDTSDELLSDTQKRALDIQPVERDKLSAQETPGRPGKPLFILNDKL